MVRLSKDEKRKALLKKQEQLAAQLKALDAKDKEKARKEDTRRKVIAGALVLEDMDKHPDAPLARRLRELLAEFVEPRSRHLFPFLPPLPGVNPGANSAPREAPRPVTSQTNVSAAPPPVTTLPNGGGFMPKVN